MPVITGGAEFHGDEIHPVMQAGDDAEISATEDFEHLGRLLENRARKWEPVS